MRGQGQETAGPGRISPGRQIAVNPTLRMVFSCIWLVYLAGPVAGLFRQHYSPLWIAGGIALTAVFCGSYFWLLLRWDAPRSRWSMAGLVLLFVLAIVACTVFSAAKWNVVWIYVAAAAGMVPRSRRHATWAVVAAGVCYLAVSVAGHDQIGDYLSTLLPVVMIGFIMIGGRRQSELMGDLRAAREEVERMAAAQERLRLARDLHDLTGQSLSTITLKSELAARLVQQLPGGPERDRAADELEQVAEVSRQALSDIRQAISGYRRPTLAVEIITARGALESAGIVPHDDSQVTLASGTFDPDAEAALAWCLREAVTNVIRHSGARNCRITLTRRSGTVSLTVRDDGRSSRPDESAVHTPLAVSTALSRPGPESGQGTGLRGMSERLAAVGGELELSPGPDGFALTATVPAGKRVTVNQ